MSDEVTLIVGIWVGCAIGRAVITAMTYLVIHQKLSRGESVEVPFSRQARNLALGIAGACVLGTVLVLVNSVFISTAWPWANS